jgi:hypothetical protein
MPRTFPDSWVDDASPLKSVLVEQSPGEPTPTLPEAHSLSTHAAVVTVVVAASDTAAAAAMARETRGFLTAR